MPPADAATVAATPEVLAASDDARRESAEQGDGGSVRLGGTVVAGPPEDAREMAHREILAALFGAQVPGAL